MKKLIVVLTRSKGPADGNEKRAEGFLCHAGRHESRAHRGETLSHASASSRLPIISSKFLIISTKFLIISTELFRISTKLFNEDNPTLRETDFRRRGMGFCRHEKDIYLAAVVAIYAIDINGDTE